MAFFTWEICWNSFQHLHLPSLFALNSIFLLDSSISGKKTWSRIWAGLTWNLMEESHKTCNFHFKMKRKIKAYWVLHLWHWSIFNFQISKSTFFFALYGNANLEKECVYLLWKQCKSHNLNGPHNARLNFLHQKYNWSSSSNFYCDFVWNLPKYHLDMFCEIHPKLLLHAKYFALNHRLV